MILNLQASAGPTAVQQAKHRLIRRIHAYTSATAAIRSPNLLLFGSTPKKKKGSGSSPNNGLWKTRKEYGKSRICDIWVHPRLNCDRCRFTRVSYLQNTRNSTIIDQDTKHSRWKRKLLPPNYQLAFWNLGVTQVNTHDIIATNPQLAGQPASHRTNQLQQWKLVREGWVMRWTTKKTCMLRMYATRCVSNVCLHVIKPQKNYGVCGGGGARDCRWNNTATERIVTRTNQPPWSYATTKGTNKAGKKMDEKKHTHTK